MMTPRVSLALIGTSFIGFLCVLIIVYVIECADKILIIGGTEFINKKITKWFDGYSHYAPNCAPLNGKQTFTVTHLTHFDGINL